MGGQHEDIRPFPVVAFDHTHRGHLVHEPTHTLAQQPVITSFEPDGTLTWSNAYSDALASIERLTDVPTTGSAVTVTETLGVSDGSSSVHNYAVAHPPIVNPSVTISDGTYSWDDLTGSSSPSIFLGAVSSYDLGQVSAIYLTEPRPVGTPITVEYSYLPLSSHLEWVSAYTTPATDQWSFRMTC